MPFDDTLSAVANPIRGIDNVKRMLANSSVLGMIGPANSILDYAEYPIANPANLAMLSPSNTNSCLTLALSYCNRPPPRLKASHPNNYFRLAAPDPVQGRAMGRFASTLGIQRVAVIDMWPGDDDLLIRNFEEAFTGRVVLVRSLNVNTTDFGGFLAAASQLGAQAVYAITDGESLTVCEARAQMTLALFPGRSYFLATDGATYDACIGQAKGNARDMYSTFSDVDPRYSTDQRVLKGIAGYLKAYPKSSDVGIYTFAAFDCARILIAAIGRAIEADQGGFPSRDQVVAALKQTNFEGVTGTFAFDSNGDAISPLMSVLKVDLGQWAYLTKIDAGPSAD
jgi:branched-chain amino acid transport system substrate-binding protein